MTNDTAATTAISDSLYVPYMYPDESDANSSSLDDYLNDGGGSCHLLDAYALADAATIRKDGQTKVCKYKGGTVKSGSSLFGSSFPLGPNLLCTTKPLLPLTTIVSDVNAAIGAMSPSGDTNLMTGVMWVWRTISPNGPFNAAAGTSSLGPQVAKAYGYVNAAGGKNHKTIVLLTDGDNHWGGQSGDSSAYGNDNNDSAYSAFGFFYENRIGGSANPTSAATAYSQMNAVTLEACTNTKAAGIEIYTVGLTATDGISYNGQQTMQKCSSGDGYYFVAADGDALKASFQPIANTMSALRVS